MDDNGIIIIKDKFNNKKKYKIVSCFEIVDTKKDYLLYTDNNDAKDDITIYTSMINQIDNNIVELSKITSESIMLQIKDIIVNIYKNNIDNKIFIPKSLNMKLNYNLIGNRLMMLPTKIYKQIKKDYNANKDNREKAGTYKYQAEYTVEMSTNADMDYILRFKSDKKYINAIRNI